MSSGEHPDYPNLTGRVIAGKIEIQEFLGGGAMGSVFRAHHRGLDKPVAVKVMRVFQDFDPLRTERFTREAKTAARFDHPHTVQILDFGEDGDDRLLYLVMEYLEGRDLHRILHRSGPIGGHKLAEVMIQALGALAAAHDRGVIHRDIKPANLMIVKRANDDGYFLDFCKVCDFGLAKMLTFDSSQSYNEATAARGVVVGTPLYMAPEQAVGDQLDGKTDVYGCGIVMYEMLTGNVPFKSDSPVAVLMKHISEPPLPPSQLVEMDRRLEEIVLWTLEKDRSQRCGPRELRRALLDLYPGPSPESLDLSPDVPIAITPAPRAKYAPVTDVLSGRTPRGRRSSGPAADPDDSVLESETLRDQPLLMLSESAIIGPAPSSSGTRSPAASSSAELLPLDAIIGPASTEQPAPPMGPTDDLIEALVAEAVESVSSVKSGPGLEDREGSLEGLDPRKHAAAVSDRAQYMWKNYGIMYEPYLGPYPFFIRDHQRALLGPLTHKDAMLVLKQEGSHGRGQHVSMSPNRETWIGAPGFVKLSGQETLLAGDHQHQADAPDSAFESLERTSFTSLFARIAREQPSGRFYFRSKEYERVEHCELHVVRGRPTFVYTSNVAYELPELLVQKGLITEAMLPRILHSVLVEQKPIEDIVGAQTGIDIVPYRAVFMRSRLLHLFQWKRRGAFRFDGGALPSSMAPFVGSILAVLPELVYHGMNAEELNAAIWPHLQRALDRSERWNTMLAQMSLTPAQRAIVKKFGKPRTLAASLECGPQEQKMHLAMAYILLETDLLLKPI